MAFPVVTDATWVLPSSVTLDAGELRRADSSAFAGVGSALGVGGGVVRHGDTSLAVTVDGSDNVTVQPGAVVIPGNAVAGTGCYRSALAAATTNALTARNATNARIDLVVYRQLDTDVVGSHGAYTARIDVIAGTPSATPAVPVLPSMAVELARITVPASGGGAASVDSSFRTYVAGIGGVIVVPTEARLPASAAKYQKARALDTGATYTFDGTVWNSNGWQTLSLTAATGWGAITARARVAEDWLVMLELSTTRSGASITASSAGNVADVQVASGLPAALTPAADRNLMFHWGAGLAGTLQVKSDGTLWLTDLYPTSAVTNAAPIVVHDSYALG